MTNFDIMKSLITITAIFLTGIIIGESCKPKPGNTITGGGKGGTYTINVTGEHHGGLLDTCKMYIKYATLDAPASGIYDDSASVTITNGVPVATFNDLTIGNYYVLAVGYHDAYSPPNVKGGKSFVISGSAQVVSDTIPTYQYNP